MSAWRYEVDGRKVIVAGGCGSWWYHLDNTPTKADKLTGPFATRAAAVEAATIEVRS